VLRLGYEFQLSNGSDSSCRKYILASAIGICISIMLASRNSRALDRVMQGNQNGTVPASIKKLLFLLCRRKAPLQWKSEHHTSPASCAYKLAHHTTCAMRFSLEIFSVLLLSHLSTALPTLMSSPTLPSQNAITAPPTATAPPSRRDDNFEPNIPPVLISIPTVSIAQCTRSQYTQSSFTLDLPPQTCTPGFSAYATPGVNGYVPAEACNALWVYSPNFAAAIAFSILFGAVTIAHLAQALLYRNGFCWVIVMAAAWETGAYAFRALSSKDQQSAGIATVAQILVLVAPICRSQTTKPKSLRTLISSSSQGSTPSPTWSSLASSTSTRLHAKS